jgi:threonine/homoserine/homoserine lactone efflux protein
MMVEVLSALSPGPAQLAAFAAAVFVLNATPGVDLLLTLTRTWQAGRRAGLAAAAGITAGCAVHALAAASGLAALLALFPLAFVALQWAGAAYLAWLGVQMLRAAARPAAPLAGAARPGDPAAAPLPAPRLAAEFRRGLLTNVLNPKVAFFFLAFLPPFVPAASPDKTLSFLLLGAWFVLQGGLFLLVVVLMADRLGQRARQRARLGAAGRLQRGLEAAAGLLFIALAWRVLNERPVSA